VGTIPLIKLDPKSLPHEY
jgi:hypothetical protein